MYNLLQQVIKYRGNTVVNPRIKTVLGNDLFFNAAY